MITPSTYNDNDDDDDDDDDDNRLQDRVSVYFVSMGRTYPPDYNSNSYGTIYNDMYSYGTF